MRSSFNGYARLVLVLAAAVGCADAGDDARSRGAAIDFADARGLPGDLDARPAWAVYLVHVPTAEADAPKHAEIAFALTGGGYEMDAMEVGLAGSSVGDWIRFAIVQDLTVAPLGARYLDDGGALSHVWAHGRIGGVAYDGMSTEVHLTADLHTGAIDGDFALTLVGEGAPAHHVELRFTGQLARDCGGWIYAPGLDIGTAAATGGPCFDVLAAIDAVPGPSDTPELPPGFVAPAPSPVQ